MLTSFFLCFCCFSLINSSPIHLKTNDEHSNRTHLILKSVQTSYIQHISNHGQCSIEINDDDSSHSFLTEGELVRIKDKWFKVENCRLNRAYMAPCGSKIFDQMLDFICVITGKQDERKIFKRNINDEDLIDAIDRSYFDVCCRSACTIAELLQYCNENIK